MRDVASRGLSVAYIIQLLCNLQVVGSEDVMGVSIKYGPFEACFLDVDEFLYIVHNEGMLDI